MHDRAGGQDRARKRHDSVTTIANKDSNGHRAEKKSKHTQPLNARAYATLHVSISLGNHTKFYTHE